MTINFYVPPEQQMKDRAEFARAGIARGRSVVVLRYAGGIALVAENPSTTLHKVSEIYDRIAFAAVGRYNEFESLRLAGIQSADVRGYTFDRADVTARALVNMYAQLLGSVFASADKPFEVELAVAEVGEGPTGDRLFRIAFDGSVYDEPDVIVMGGSADALRERLRDLPPDADLATAVRAAVAALAGASGGAPAAEPAAGAGPEHRPAVEVAVLDRDRPRRRKFVRLTADRVQELLS